jgi:hypothetical protein
VVRDLRHRDRDDAGAAMTVLDFRIERHDANGNRLAPVPVQMRGLSFTGAVNNGDEIRVRSGKWRDGTLRVEHLDNLTTGAKVRTESGHRAVGCFFFAVLSIILVGFAFLAVVFVNSVILGNDRLPWEP